MGAREPTGTSTISGIRLALLACPQPATVQPVNSPAATGLVLALTAGPGAGRFFPQLIMTDCWRLPLQANVIVISPARREALRRSTWTSNKTGASADRNDL